MSVDVIPAGSNIVVTDKEEKWVNLMEAIKDAQSDGVRTTKDAEAQLSKQIGDDYADTVKTVKDAEAQLAAQAGAAYADTVKTLKDVESQLKDKSDANTIHLVQDIKDAESRLDRSAGDRFINTIQDIKDFEARQFKDASDKFIQTIQDVKNAAKDSAQQWAHTNEHMSNVQSHVSELALKEFAHARERREQLAREAEKLAYQNQMATMLAFKEQAMLSERLAASTDRQLAECCCELKERVDSVKEDAKNREIAQLREQLTEAKLLGRRFRTFSPVPVGTLQASDED